MDVMQPTHLLLDNNLEEDIIHQRLGTEYKSMAEVQPLPDPDH